MTITVLKSTSTNDNAVYPKDAGLLSATLNAGGWILIGCQCFYLSSAEIKIILKMIPIISLLCAIIVIVVNSAIFLYSQRVLKLSLSL